MDEEKTREMLRQGIELLQEGRAVEAVFFFEEMIQACGRGASVLSWLGVATAKATGDLRAAEKLCLEALQIPFPRPIYFRNLAQIYILWGRKPQAVAALRKGLKVDKRNRPIINELVKLGVRKNPPIPFLARNNPINKIIGIARSRFSS